MSTSHPRVEERRLMLRDNTKAYHENGTEYVNYELEQRVHEAIARHTTLRPQTLAALAAIGVVMDWLETVEPDYEAAWDELDHGVIAEGWGCSFTIPREVVKDAVDIAYRRGA